MKMIFIAGVTGSGKTSLALQLASTHNLHLISVDSVQIYRNLSIFSNKPTDPQTHFLIDTCDISDTFDVDLFISHCDSEIARAVELKKIPTLVGGTGLYFSRLNFQKTKFDIIKVFLTQERTGLYKRLDTRCENMILEGGLNEVWEMKRMGLDLEKTIGRSIGCRDALILIEELQKGKFEDEILFDKFMNDFKRRTRNYARKQECWFKKKDFVWIDTEKFDPLDFIEKHLCGILDKEELEKVHEQSIKTNINARKVMKTYVSPYRVLSKEMIKKIIEEFKMFISKE